jgi:hypothetical protein
MVDRASAGEVTRAWNRVGPIVERVAEDKVRTHAVSRIVPTVDILQPRLRGTVAQKHFQPHMLS